MESLTVAAESDRTIRGVGTPEEEWQRWPGWQRPASALTELVRSRLVVVAPHPDDEVIAAGGLVHDAAASGLEVLVVAVTDGGASHPGSARWPVAALRRQRQLERENALVALGISARAVIELDIPDGSVGAHRRLVVNALREALRPGDTVIAPWRWDGHPDHEATCEAASIAVAARPVEFLQAPIWGWHWAAPDQLPAQAYRYRLSEAGLAAKRTALAEFTSQLEPDPSTGAGPILPEFAVRRWLRADEVYLHGVAV